MSYLKKILFIISVVFGLIALILGNNYISKENLLIYATGSNEKAFLYSTWGMSPKEVERANKTNLSKPTIDLMRFTDTSGFSVPEIIDQKRYKSLEQNDFNIWGSRANIDYGFFDSKLFKYQVTIECSDENIEETQKKMLSTFSEKYGKFNFKPKSESYILDGVLDTKKINASIWVFNKDKFYIVGVRVYYKPILNEIKKISEKENANIF